jgi:hypothetical protein
MPTPLFLRVLVAALCWSLLAGCDQQAADPAIPTPATPAQASAPEPPKPAWPPADRAGSGVAHWYLLAPDGAGFEMRFPLEPESKQADQYTVAGGIRNQMFVAVTPEGGAYSLGISEKPAGAVQQIETSAEFDEVRDKLVAKLKGKLIREKAETLQGHEGRSLLITGQGPQGESLIRVRLLRAGFKTYQAMTAHPIDRDQGIDAMAFLNSLRIAPAPAAP